MKTRNSALKTRNSALHTRNSALKTMNFAGEVLSHMDMVKSVRNRIKDTLTKTSLVRRDPQPEVAQLMLDNAIGGEVALLEMLCSWPGDYLPETKITRKVRKS